MLNLRVCPRYVLSHACLPPFHTLTIVFICFIELAPHFSYSTPQHGHVSSDCVFQRCNTVFSIMYQGHTWLRVHNYQISFYFEADEMVTSTIICKRIVIFYMCKFHRYNEPTSP